MMSLLVLLGTALLAQADGAQEPLRASGEDLRPGLVATYRSLEQGGGDLVRIDPRPAFVLGHSSPHPRIAPGRFSVRWEGVIVLQDSDALAFDAFLGGGLRVEVGGRVVLEGEGRSDTARVRGTVPFDRKPGLYRIRVDYRSLEGVPARLQLWWEGRTFSREPLPAWKLKHLDSETPPEERREEQVSKGRLRAGKWGCARCHASSFPGLVDPPPGPSLADVGGRVNRTWLLEWLGHPQKLRPGARMPSLFGPDRQGQVERWIVADYLLRATSSGARRDPLVAGDHRLGKRWFLSLGCIACHFVPDEDTSGLGTLGRSALEGLNDRMSPPDLIAFLGNPHARYPDGRMPRLPVPPDYARDIAAYLQLWSGPPVQDVPLASPVTPQELDPVFRRLHVRGIDAAGRALVAEKRCMACHVGLGDSLTDDVPLVKTEAGCLGGQTGPRFAHPEGAKSELGAYLSVAGRERPPSPNEARQARIRHLGCLQCHARDTDRPPPIEAVGSTLGGAYLQTVPFQRTPRLSNALSKYRRGYLLSALQNGVSGVRPKWYTYRMPAFGQEAESLVEGLAEADGDLASGPEPAPPEIDPTLFTLGPSLVGFEGYSCVSCHVWNGQQMAEADPGAVGPELTTAVLRVRQDWFERFLEDPSRAHPGTPMPQIFKKGQPATLPSVLGGDALKQREALFAYLSRGKDAPSPKPLPPLPVTFPRPGEPPVIAQIPLTLPDKTIVESLAVLYSSHDVLVYDVGRTSLRNVYVGAQILRSLRGRLRWYGLSGKAIGPDLASVSPGTFLGYVRLGDGVRVERKEGPQTFRLVGRQVRVEGGAGERVIDLPPAEVPAPLEPLVLPDSGKIEGTLERPGYRAIAYPRPKTVSGDDLLMPGAVAVHPRDGRVFVASMKLGEIFVLRDPGDQGKGATFEDYAHGLFQEALSMKAESDGLYVLHRRNLTKIVESKGDGVADRFERVAALPHGVAETYDYAYGLARDKSGAFVITYAPYANTTLPGSGSLVRLSADPTGPPEEVAYGFRNPLGWCAGPEGEIFFTDNQGEWVATNKLSHIVPGRFYGFPNSAQKQHAQKPLAKPAVWVPYGWAHSINGMAYDETGGKFGPFAGQIFLAELMYGGAIVRANLERVNGEYQGACFLFWGKGLLGPLTLAFDPKGRLYVGGITEPGWMAQPDRGALFRIDFTGTVPFEIQEIHARPQGFRLVFTLPVHPAQAVDRASYQIEHYRYEYTGAYGSPELDRTPVSIERVDVGADGRTVDVTTSPLVRDRVYLITARGVTSREGAPLVTPTGAYTLNEIPRP
jgi:glucose/arabinose dehydrogenase/mono/diheme cytochrome c family protein